MRSLDAATEHAVRRFLDLLQGRYDVAEAIVFGSRARGTHRSDSDLDVAVLLRGEPLRFADTKLQMADLAFYLMLETGLLISPMPVWMSEWENPENYSNPDLLRTIDREGIRLRTHIV